MVAAINIGRAAPELEFEHSISGSEAKTPGFSLGRGKSAQSQSFALWMIDSFGSHMITLKFVHIIR